MSSQKSGSKSFRLPKPPFFAIGSFTPVIGGVVRDVSVSLVSCLARLVSRLVRLVSRLVRLVSRLVRLVAVE